MPQFSLTVEGRSRGNLSMCAMVQLDKGRGKDRAGVRGIGEQGIKESMSTDPMEAMFGG